LVKPYTELKLRNGKIRVFREDVKEEDLIWHRDLKDRTLVVLEGYGWQLQIDNEIPMDLLQGHSYSIVKNEYHRLIKGEGDLVIRIYEDN
jgi:hypothetical protein